MKRHEPTLASIPAKSTRFANNSTNVTTLRGATNKTTSTGGGIIGKFKRTLERSASATNTTNSDTITIQNSRRVPGQNNEGNKMLRRATATTLIRGVNGKLSNTATGSNATSISTTGAGKTINKRIPPYDFKARYNDLLEKHKILKSKYDEKCEQVSSWENLPEQLEETQLQLSQTEEELSNLKTENKAMQRQIASQGEEIETINDNLQRTTELLQNLQTKYNVSCFKILHNII